MCSHSTGDNSLEETVAGIVTLSSADLHTVDTYLSLAESYERLADAHERLLFLKGGA